MVQSSTASTDEYEEGMVVYNPSPQNVCPSPPPLLPSSLNFFAFRPKEYVLEFTMTYNLRAKFPPPKPL